MSVWSEMAGTLAASAVADAATYKVGGTGDGTSVRVIRAERDMDAALVGRSVRLDRIRLDVRVSDVATPAKGDTVTIGAKTWKVQTAPTQDPLGIWWTLECYPA